MRYRDSEATLTLFVCAAVGLGMVYFARYMPALDAYRYAADEGTYFRQASLIARDGFTGFAELCRSYLANTAEHTAPPPFRIAHLTVASWALAIAPTIRTLSWLSLAFHGLTCLSVYGLSRGLWGARAAAAASLLQLVSPLAAGSALRALLDTHVGFVSITTLLLFCRLLTPAPRAFWWFSCALGYSLLLKESGYFIAPFYALVLGLWRVTGAVRVTLWQLALVALLIPAATLLVTAWLLGGVAPFEQAIGIALGFNAQEPHAYLAAFGAGPWYEYVVDFLLLSPATTLLSLFFTGQLLARIPTTRATAVACAFVLYFFGVFAALPKNPRFAVPLDPLFRLGAVGMLAQLLTRIARPAYATAVGGVAVCLLMLSDLRSFHRFFVTGAVYDPVAYNLLAVERMIPVAPAPAQRDSIDENSRRVGTAEAYLSLSLAEYEAKHFEAAARASLSALRLRPDFAPAYNNLGLAYAGLARFREAISAFEAALRIDPNFGLARNNLAWIRREAEAKKAPE